MGNSKLMLISQDYHQLKHVPLNFTIPDIDNCTPDPCQNGATCQDQVNGYTCQCAPGYTGTNCSTGKQHTLDVPNWS